MSQPYLSKERAKTLLVEIVEASPPGSKNPRENPKLGTGMCAYWQPDAKGQKRCIVGEMFHRMGIPKPKRNTGVGYLGYSDKGYMSRETERWLAKVQGRFDDYQVLANGKRRDATWRQALKECRSRELL